jgi:hypothetical protein
MAKITMSKDSLGSANQWGNAAMRYEEGKTYDMEAPWQQTLADVFVGEGWATVADKKETKVVAPDENQALDDEEIKPKSKGKKKKW